MKHYTATDNNMIKEMNERMNTFNSQVVVKETNNDQGLVEETKEGFLN
jgi:hypothetical protein